MKILVTGSNGFAGSHLLDHLLTNNNNKIFGLVKVNARMRNVKHLVDKVNFIEGDLTDPVSINNLIKLVKPDFVYHLGALSWVSPSWKMPSAYFNVNAIGTINLFESIRSEQINPKILVLLGSTALNSLIGNEEVISRVRGKWIQKEIGTIKPWIIISFHPAFLMRQPQQKKLAWIDLKMIREKYKSITSVT